MQNETIISLEHVNKAFGNKVILRDYSLRLSRGSLTALSGVSGAGKTTLLNLILGLTPADSGEILTSENADFFVVFQEDRLINGTTAINNLDVYPHPLRRELALSVLEALGLERDDILCRKLGSYSGGMKRRVAIARALYGCMLYSGLQPVRFPVLILDEPFKGLDYELKQRVIAYVGKTVSDTKATLFIVTHAKEEATALGCDLLTI